MLLFMSLVTLHIIAPNFPSIRSIPPVFNVIIEKDTISHLQARCPHKRQPLSKLYRCFSFGKLVSTSADRSFAQSVFPRRLILTLDSRNWLSRDSWPGCWCRCLAKRTIIHISSPEDHLINGLELLSHLLKGSKDVQSFPDRTQPCCSSL